MAKASSRAAAGRGPSRTRNPSPRARGTTTSGRVAATAGPWASTSAANPWSGFHKLGREAREARLREAGVDPEALQALRDGSLSEALGASFIENHAGSFPLPLGLAVGFVVDGMPATVPMAVEESSVVAAACNGARMVALGGGFVTRVGAPVMIGQVEVRRVKDPALALRVVRSKASVWRKRLDATIPSMVARGGGVRAVKARWIGDRVVVHVHVDCRDAMGANLVNTLCESLAPLVAQALRETGAGGVVGLRILSNLATQRMAGAAFDIPVAAVGGLAVAKAIVEADRFAHRDPFRAATHNKGILNGIDPIAIATGNDWRAIEAGAHAWAARDGHYGALTRYSVSKGRLKGRLALPLAVGTVGGVTRLHPTAKACLRILGDPDARRLAAVMVSVGLAQNLAALRALATQGIQAGHMALHARNLALAAGFPPAQAKAAADQMVAQGQVTPSRARELWAQAGRR